MLGATLWQAGRTAEQARRAEASRDFLVDLFVAADPERMKELYDMARPGAETHGCC